MPVYQGRTSAYSPRNDLAKCSKEVDRSRIIVILVVQSDENRTLILI